MIWTHSHSLVVIDILDPVKLCFVLKGYRTTAVFMSLRCSVSFYLCALDVTINLSDLTVFFQHTAAFFKKQSKQQN